MNGATGYRVPLPCPICGGLAYRRFNERGLLRQRAFPPGISPANASITNAVYVNRPVTSGTQVKSRGTVIGRRRAASADGAAGAAAVHPAAPQPEGDGHGGNDKAPDTQSPESPRRADVADQPVEVHPEKSGQDGKREEDRGQD